MSSGYRRTQEGGQHGAEVLEVNTSKDKVSRRQEGEVFAQEVRWHQTQQYSNYVVGTECDLVVTYHGGSMPPSSVYKQTLSVDTLFDDRGHYSANSQATARAVTTSLQADQPSSHRIERPVNLSCNALCWKADGPPPWMAMEIGGPSSEPEKRRVGTARFRSMNRMHVLWIVNLATLIGYIVLMNVAAVGSTDRPLTVTTWTVHLWALASVGNQSKSNIGVSVEDLRIDTGAFSVATLVLLECTIASISSAIVVVFSVVWTLYYWWIDQCRQPLRWVERAICDTLGLVALALIAGVRTRGTLLAIGFLHASAVGFQWVAEALCRPDERERERIPNADHGRNAKWEIRGQNQGLLVFGCAPPSATTVHTIASSGQRCAPVLLSVLLQAASWTVVMTAYYRGAVDVHPPSFVQPLLWSQFIFYIGGALFPLIYFTTERGCRSYYRMEIVFILWTLTARAMLTLVIMANALQFSEFVASLA